MQFKKIKNLLFLFLSTILIIGLTACGETISPDSSSKITDNSIDNSIEETSMQNSSQGNESKDQGCEHIIVTDPEINPTCTETGLTEGSHCDKCGFIITEQKEIPSIEHSFDNEMCTTCGFILPSEGLSYKLSTDESYYIVVGKGICDSAYISIPAIYNGLPVKEIGENAFYEENIVAVTIPESITRIAQGAFYCCSSLKHVTLAEGLESLDAYAFAATGLRKIDIPSSVTVIGDYAFELSKLETVVLHSGLCTIGLSTFFQTGLKEICVPETVTELGAYAFARCEELAEVSLGNGITAINEGTFDGCSKLTKINFPSSLSEIGADAFRRSGLKEVNLPDCVTVIRQKAFQDCINLETVIVNAESIGEYGERDHIFGNCPNLKTVVIGDRTKTIGCFAFYDCYALEHVTIGKNVEIIGRNAFNSCQKIKTINLPNTLKTIGDEAFSDCNDLQYLIIPRSVETVGEAIFEFCDSLGNVYCEATEKPDGWNQNWLDSHYKKEYTAYWGDEWEYIDGSIIMK